MCSPIKSSPKKPAGIASCWRLSLASWRSCCLREDLDLALTGFDAAEIDAILGDFSEPGPSPEDAQPSPGPAVARAGDVWVLHKHRLLCGDARSAADLDRLLGGRQAAVVFTDPPYNVAIGRVVGRGRVKHRDFKMASGEMSRADFTRFLVGGRLTPRASRAREPSTLSAWIGAMSR